MKNLINETFGKLTVISLAYSKNNRLFWNCQCDCGNMRVCNGGSLKAGGTTSCGCGKIRNLTGKKFEKLIVLEQIKNKRSNGGGTIWKCKCDCGKEIEATANHLTQGNTKSCGCMIHHQVKTGDKFNYLTILEPFSGINNQHQYTSKCQCDCGKIKEIPTHRIVKGVIKSCGCFANKLKKHGLFKGYEEIYGNFWKDIQHEAKIRNLEFNITIEQIWDLFIKQDRRCALTGLELQFKTTSQSSDGTASLDRIDSSKGYTMDNIQWIHKDINRMKWDMDENKFVNYCKLIAEHNK